MSEDISAELGGMIADAKVFGSSDNIRHGKYEFLIKTVRAELIEVEKGKHKFVFWELQPTKSEPNPQIEGDRVDYVSKDQPGTGPLKDDGRTPNEVGSNCALKIDFDGAGARSAPANAQAPILALFNKQTGQLNKEELNSTWLDISRKQPVRKGEVIGFDPSTKQVIHAQADKPAQMARGFIIGCTTSARKKKEPNQYGMYVTKLNWFCVAPIGQGINSLDKVAERRAKIEMSLPDDEDETPSTSTTVQVPANLPQMPQMPLGVSSTPPPGGVSVPATPPQVVAPAIPAPPAPPQAPPPAPPAPWSPPSPWRVHPTAPGWYWDGGEGVKNEAQLRAGL
jgi:hypothetical protein